MDKPHVLPCIAREDYDNFRQDIGLAASTSWSDWSGLMARQVAAVRDSGRPVVLAEINYDHFREYCRANGCKPDQQMLLAYSRFKKSIDVAYPA